MLCVEVHTYMYINFHRSDKILPLIHVVYTCLLLSPCGCHKLPPPPYFNNHPLTQPPTHSLTHPLTHSLTHPLTHSLTHSLTHPLTHPPTHSPTHPLTHSPTHPLTHSPTHPLTILTHHSHPPTHSTTAHSPLPGLHAWCNVGEGFGHIEPYIGNWVLCQCQHHRKHGCLDHLRGTHLHQHLKHKSHHHTHTQTHYADVTVKYKDFFQV